MGWLSLALKIGGWIAGLFGFGQKDERDEERKAGRELGQQESQNNNAQEALHELQTADDAGAANRPTTQRLSDGTDPAAKPYTPGPD